MTNNWYALLFFSQSNTPEVINLNDFADKVTLLADEVNELYHEPMYLPSIVIERSAVLKARLNYFWLQYYTIVVKSYIVNLYPYVNGFFYRQAYSKLPKSSGVHFSTDSIKRRLIHLSQTLTVVRKKATTTHTKYNFIFHPHIVSFVYSLGFYSMIEAVHCNELVFFLSGFLIHLYVLLTTNTLHRLARSVFFTFYFFLTVQFLHTYFIFPNQPFIDFLPEATFFFYYTALVLLAIHAYHYFFSNLSDNLSIDSMYSCFCSMLNLSYFDWGRFLSVVMSCLCLPCGFILFRHMFFDDITVLFSFSVSAIINSFITFFQTLHEELVYRSILLQFSDSIFSQSLVACFYSCIFGLRHFDFDTIKAIFFTRSRDLISELSFFTGFGFAASIFCIHTQGLEYSWGIHFAHNFSIDIFHMVDNYLFIRFSAMLTTYSHNSHYYQHKQSVVSALQQFIPLTLLHTVITLLRVYLSTTIYNLVMSLYNTMFTTNTYKVTCDNYYENTLHSRFTRPQSALYQEDSFNFSSSRIDTITGITTSINAVENPNPNMMVTAVV